MYDYCNVLYQVYRILVTVYGSYTFDFISRHNYNLVCIAVVMLYILLSSKYWCTDSLKMAEVRRSIDD